MLEIAIWLSETKWSIALHESLYMYPWIESGTCSLDMFFYWNPLICRPSINGGRVY